MDLSRKTKGMIMFTLGSIAFFVALVGKAFIPDFAHGFFFGLSMPLLIAGAFFLFKSRSA
jgi:hypothetical protein